MGVVAGQKATADKEKQDSDGIPGAGRARRISITVHLAFGTARSTQPKLN